MLRGGAAWRFHPPARGAVHDDGTFDLAGHRYDLVSGALVTNVDVEEIVPVTEGWRSPDGRFHVERQGADYLRVFETATGDDRLRLLDEQSLSSHTRSGTPTWLDADTFAFTWSAGHRRIAVWDVPHGTKLFDRVVTRQFGFWMVLADLEDTRATSSRDAVELDALAHAGPRPPPGPRRVLAMHARDGTSLELLGVPVDILPDAAWVTTRDPQTNTLIFVSKDRLRAWRFSLDDSTEAPTVRPVFSPSRRYVVWTESRSSGRRLGAADLVRGRVYGETAIVPWGSP